MFIDHKKKMYKRNFSFKKGKYQLSLFLYLLTRVEKDKMVSCGKLGCKN